MPAFTSAGEPGAAVSVNALTVTSFEGKTPRLGAGTWVHPSADVIGDVSVGRDCWLGPGARLRGDYAAVGMGAVVSDWAKVGEWGVIAEGAVVPVSLLERAVDDEYRAAWYGFKQIYVDLCARYREGARDVRRIRGGDPARRQAAARPLRRRRVARHSSASHVAVCFLGDPGPLRPQRLGSA